MTNMNEAIAEALRVLNPRSRPVDQIQRDTPSADQKHPSGTDGKPAFNGNCPEEIDHDAKPLSQSE